jgi:hypothetical protein
MFREFMRAARAHAGIGVLGKPAEAGEPIPA